MKNIKYILLIIISSFYLASCESELDIEPQQSVSEGVATNNANNVEAILLGAYAQARGDGNLRGTYDGYLANIAVLLGNSNQVEWNGTFANLRDIYQKQMINNNSAATAMYGNSYIITAAVNTVLVNLDKFEDEDRRKKVEGEAKFIRGIVLFDMTRLFGQQYNTAGNNTQLGVPIVLDPPNIARSVPRNTVEENYTQVISDLIDAYNLLPDANGVRADKYAAAAILARVYLQQGNYEQAKDFANDVIVNSGNGLMPNYNAVFDTDDNTNETIFSWIITEQEGNNRQNTHFATEALGGRGGDISITQDYLDLFDSNADQRKAYVYTDSGLTLSTKFVRQYANTQQIRLAEMYLIRAECNFRLGTSTGATALEDINTVRNRSSAPSLTSLTLNIILNERERELGFEGFLLHDYKRTQRNIGGLPYNDNKLVFPIPQSAIDRNPLLNQNPGY